ncbi:hypothetical protein T4E_526 [Trichinella pseudospiralis]|uniref:Uncharacterized protein n=1 Tax=Trichinella pseudospiralis TaxID=6337 RepID=A0A0V0XDY7_TRIPS|nr:hypothetical protein T4E_526 [Trichinella pseudospiralis]
MLSKCTKKQSRHKGVQHFDVFERSTLQARPSVPQLKRRLFEYYGESDDERFNVLRLQTLLDSLY